MTTNLFRRGLKRWSLAVMASATPIMAQTQPATLASPSGAETQAGGGELAAAATTEAGIAEAAEAGAEGPEVAPVAEGNVPRETETEAPIATQAAGNGSAGPETQDLQAKAEKAEN